MSPLLLAGWLLSSAGCTGQVWPGVGGAAFEKACEDTAASISPWEPGDPVPGWDDYACPLPPGAGYVATTLVTAIGVAGGFTGGDGGLSTRGFYLLLGDCETGVCDPTSYEPPPEAPYAMAGLQDNLSDVSSRGQGSYSLHDSLTEPYSVRSSQGVLKLSAWFEAPDDPFDTNGHAEVCIERFRPDELRGTIAVAGGDLGPSGPYDVESFRILVRFDVLFVDHAGFYSPGSDTGEPVGADRARVEYSGMNYDDAWPWADITDPSVRDELYARFTPWNEP